MDENRFQRDFRWKREQFHNWWANNPLKGRWQHYMPSFWFFLGAWIVSSFPALAVFLVVGALMSIGIFYAFIVRQIHKSQDQMAQGPGDPFSEGYRSGEPTFRNVTVHMTRRGFKFPG